MSKVLGSQATTKCRDACEPDPIPYELRIGVPGHCKIEDPAEPATAVKDVVNLNILEVLEGSLGPSAR